MNFLSTFFTITLIALFTFTASASTFNNNPTKENSKEKTEKVSEDGNSKDNKDKDEESALTNLDLTSTIVNKVKPTQLEVANTTSISLDLEINDKIEHSPKLN